LLSRQNVHQYSALLDTFKKPLVNLHKSSRLQGVGVILNVGVILKYSRRCN